MSSFKLPALLKDKIDLTYLEYPTMGYSEDQVLLIKQGYQNKDIVIKYSKRKEVHKEALILKWLNGYIQVPHVYFDFQEDGIYYLVMEMLPGVMGQYGFNQLSEDEMIKLYALEIKKWHQIQIENFPNVNTLQEKLEHVRNNVEKHLVKTQYFEREYQGKTPEELYQKMMLLYPREFDLVLCHGDVCMPNFMIENGKVTGWIDVIGCGVNDRYLDVAIALRTLRFNFEAMHQEFTKERMQLFLKTYGLNKLDMKKLEFYILLDEMTNN